MMQTRKGQWKVQAGVLCGAAVALAVNGCGGGSGGGPSTPPISVNKIAFASSREGNFEIYKMNVDGTDQVNLTRNPASDTQPSWSPDGSKIAFSSRRDDDGEIYVMNEDGSGQTRLTNRPGLNTEPAWSPDGRHIAFASLEDSDGAIYVINTDGTGVRRIVDFGASPTWSPDGTKLAFSGAPGVSPRSLPSPIGPRLIPPPPQVYIWTINANGTDVKRLQEQSAGLEPDWSPDGTKIVFRRFDGDTSQLLVINPDGTNGRQVIGEGAEPVFSPDSNEIAYSGPNAEIYVVRLDGTGKRQLTNNGYVDGQPLVDGEADWK